MAFIAIIGAVFVAWLCYGLYFSEAATLRQALRRAKRIPISQFPEGRAAKIVGRLEYVDEPLSAPLTGRLCALYEAVVEENKNQESWERVIREERGVRFRLVDGTGHAIIDPTHARTILVQDSRTESGTLDDATPVEKEFLARHGESSTGWVFNRTLRYVEGVLEADEEVAVLGFGMWEPDPDGATAERGYRDGPPMRLVMSGSAEHPLLITDQANLLGRAELQAFRDGSGPSRRLEG